LPVGIVRPSPLDPPASGSWHLRWPCAHTQYSSTWF